MTLDTTYCIHIFRRDYRLYDNTTLIEACKTHSIVIPIFIFTYKQIKDNPYRSDNCVQFLCNALLDLNKQLNNRLIIFYGDEFDILEWLIKSIPELKTISFNLDYTKYAKQRDARIKVLCDKNDIGCLSLDDICLNPIGTILTTTGTIYTKFTPFFRASSSKTIRKPIVNKYDNYLSQNTTYCKKLKDYKHYLAIHDVMKSKSDGGVILGNINSKILSEGGRTFGLDILKKMLQWKTYNKERDQLMYKTTHLSAYNKFGCLSIREVYYTMVDKLGKSNDLIKQLIWRDFFYNLSDKYPEIYEDSLNPKYRNIKWKTDIKGFNAWCDGKTGFPIVDACMRELNTTGYMHNRGRLIVSNFLCRLLHINWQLGEKYFATRLVDYDPAQNNFGWQVSGANSSGTTSRPLEQTILNPWLQSWQFDRNGEYIKKWCPELVNISAADLHKWNDKYILYKDVKYNKPMLDYKTEKENNLKLYKQYI